MATTTQPTGRESDKFMLRLPDGMRDRLKELAAVNGRTLNAEIVHRLQLSLQQSQAPSADGAPEDLANRLSTFEQGVLFELHSQLVESVKRMVQAEVEKARLGDKP